MLRLSGKLQNLAYSLLKDHGVVVLRHTTIHAHALTRQTCNMNTNLA